MIRKLVFVLCAMSLTLASCGRQVTPNRTGTSAQGLQPGYMQIKFNTYQQMSFTDVWYVIVLNTSGPAPGTNGEPYAFFGNPAQNWVNYSFEIVVYQIQGQAAPTAALIQFVTTTGPGGGTIKTPTQPLTYNPQQLQLNPNCNGQGTQFCVTIDRHLFSGIGSVATATPSPTASPSSSPSATPAPPATSGVWYINWFTVQPSGGGAGAGGTVIDQPGPQGPNDQTWLPPNTNYDTATAFDLPWNAVPSPGWPQVTPPEAQISGGEVLNAP